MNSDNPLDDLSLPILQQLVDRPDDGGQPFEIDGSQPLDIDKVDFVSALLRGEPDEGAA